MKIAYLVNQYPKISHTFIRREILELERQGFSVKRLSLRAEPFDSLGDEDKSEFNKTTFILEHSKAFLLLSFIGWAVTNMRTFSAVLGLVLKMHKKSTKKLFKHFICLIEARSVASECQNADVAHIHTHFGTNSAEVAMYASLISNIPYSITIHGPEEFDYPSDLNLNEKITRSKFVVGVSSFGRSQLYRWLASDMWHKVQVVRCGLEKEYFEQAPPSLTTIDKANTTTFLCIGRLCEQKGQLLLVKAFKNHLDAGFKSKLVLAGDGDMRQAIEALIKHLNISDAVKITGWVKPEEVKALLVDCTAMVLPSFAEGLPVAIMEAMAMRRLVVSTYIAGIPELVEDKVSGLLAFSGSVADLQSKLDTVANLSDQNVKKMLDSAQIKVREMHNIEKEAAKLASLIKGEEC